MSKLGNSSSASPAAMRSARRPCVAVRRVSIVAPSRLHFGLLSFGHSSGRQYGGIGLMIDQPAVRLSLTAADRLTIEFEAPDQHPPCLETDEIRRLLAHRVHEFAARWAIFHGMADPPCCCMTIQATPPQHVGLGTGTQLALSVAAGLNAIYALGQPAPVELAMSVGRGLRSAVGTYGFVQGGLIVERGKLPGEPIAPLDCRLELPEPWRVVLVQPSEASGLSGTAEQEAFERLPPVPVQITSQLADEIRLHTLPAAARGDFERFSESIYRYGRLAGQCFAPIQGGPYNGPYLQQLVETIRSLGVDGVGQSSWGPSLFALLPDQAAAETFQRRLCEQLPTPWPTIINTPLNCNGAQVTVNSRGRPESEPS